MRLRLKCAVCGEEFRPGINTALRKITDSPELKYEPVCLGCDEWPESPMECVFENGLLSYVTVTAIPNRLLIGTGELEATLQGTLNR